jgi:hypothetical protein
VREALTADEWDVNAIDLDDYYLAPIFERPFEPGGPQVLVIRSPVPMAAWLEEAVAG